MTPHALVEKDGPFTIRRTYTVKPGILDRLRACTTLEEATALQKELASYRFASQKAISRFTRLMESMF